jgi:hypothetical protein
VEEKQALSYRAMHNWFLTPQGNRVANAFAAEIEEFQSYFKGNTLVQLGHCGQNPWLPLLSYHQKWVISPDLESTAPSCITSLNEIPLDRESVDCVIAPLISEMFPRSQSPIDEIDRILKPMGYIIFFGINPWSFWGMALRWGKLKNFAAKKAATSLFHLKRAMLNRGYQQCFLSSFFYIPPFSNPKIISKFEFLNEVGKMVKPFPAGFYCLVVQKYQHAQPFLMADAVAETMACKSTWRAASNTRLSKNL